MLLTAVNQGGGRMKDKSVPFFHEDDYCQKELLPRSVEALARRQMAEIATFAAAHEAPGGGWTEMYVRQEPRLFLLRIFRLRASRWTRGCERRAHTTPRCYFWVWRAPPFTGIT